LARKVRVSLLGIRERGGTLWLADGASELQNGYLLVVTQANDFAHWAHFGPPHFRPRLRSEEATAVRTVAEIPDFNETNELGNCHRESVQRQPPRYLEDGCKHHMAKGKVKDRT